MKPGWRPPRERPGLLKRVVAMFRMGKAGRHREARRLYEQLPAETQGVLALCVYLEALGDLRKRAKGRRYLREADQVEAELTEQGLFGVKPAQLRAVGRFMVEGSNPRGETSC
jgi:hypothetical protein